MIKVPHSLSVQEVTKKLQVSPDDGLTTSEVKKRQSKYGENILTYKKAKSGWLILFEQFLNPIIYVLGTASILAFAFNEWLEGFAILTVILFTAIIGFFMEWQALRSFEALQKIAQTSAQVIRNGITKQLKTRFLVPGDIILLTSGDVIPADARLITCQSMAVKEAALTGESNQVEKNKAKLSIQTPMAERSNMVFKSAIVVRGSAKAVVTAIGDQTYIGQISNLVQDAQKERSPLEKKLNKLSIWLIWLTLCLAFLIVISGYINGKDITLMIKTGIALAVAAIPEGLPIVATIALARGMVKLSKKNVIIKKLEAVQTLGETNIVCTDKTGTLTQDKMSVHKLIMYGSVLDYKNLENKESIRHYSEEHLALNKIIEVAVLCNNIQSKKLDKNPDSIEMALIDFAYKIGYNVVEIRQKHPEIKEIPFESESKWMATLNLYSTGYQACVKGAFESIINHCNYILTKDGVKPFIDKAAWFNHVKELCSNGLRTLAFAFRYTDNKPKPNMLVQDLVFLGVIGFFDPPRKDVNQAIETYKNAGIKVVMITGDHPDTARKIAEEVGLINLKDNANTVIHGKLIMDIDNLSSEKEETILHAKVFARMTPKQKLDMVCFYQKHNAIVGMIGDGVNDTPALKKADIGIAMGIRGTEAAKEVADVILMDDRFTSTELAIRQGRTIYENIRHFVVYLLSCNFAEIISIAIAAIFSLPLPLLPLQILFLNLVTDVFPALALGMGMGKKDIMKQLPRDPKEPIITRKLWISTIIYGMSITLAVIGISFYAHIILELPYRTVNNMAFFTLLFAQLINVFNIPHRRFSFFQNEVTKNLWVWLALILSLLIVVTVYLIPLTRKVLLLVPLTMDQFITIGVFVLCSLLISQAIKRFGGTV
ncbi:cation-translocating P-type ATPase [Changchengzhania lutea]|uniref:cation-translocating P-type ATPase n=1 Tax=Changchengzhania lutea TaxID=2049305 RepID=UPI00115CC332|nr:cation-transporting P-type ATPase [Changchengzhania lutea]